MQANLSTVLADALTLSATDRAILEGYLSRSRAGVFELEPESVRASDPATLRSLWNGERVVPWAGKTLAG